MRGEDVQQLGMFSYVSVDERLPIDHPIRKLRIPVDTILKELDEVLAPLYARGWRVSIPPERLLRPLLQVIYSVRSEHSLMEQLNYSLLFRWFVGLNIGDAVWDHSMFSFNRDRLFDAQIAQDFFAHTVLLARLNELVSDEHFSVDGTLLEAWASHRSVRPKDGSDIAMAGASVAISAAMTRLPWMLVPRFVKFVLAMRPRRASCHRSSFALLVFTWTPPPVLIEDRSRMRRPCMPMLIAM